VVSRVGGRYESLRGPLRCTDEAQRLDQAWHYVKMSPISFDHCVLIQIPFDSARYKTIFVIGDVRIQYIGSTI